MDRIKRSLRVRDAVWPSPRNFRQKSSENAAIVFFFFRAGEVFSKAKRFARNFLELNLGGHGFSRAGTDASRQALASEDCTFVTISNTKFKCLTIFSSLRDKQNARGIANGKLFPEEIHDHPNARQMRRSSQEPARASVALAQQLARRHESRFTARREDRLQALAKDSPRNNKFKRKCLSPIWQSHRVGRNLSLSTKGNCLFISSLTMRDRAYGELPDVEPQRLLDMVQVTCSALL